MSKFAPYPRLFGVCDSEVATLPAPLLAARRAIQNLEATVTALTPPPSADERLAALVAEVATSAAEGSPDLDVSELVGMRQAEADHETRARLVTRALERARQNLAGEVEDRTEEIVTEHLAPAVEALVDEARRLLARFAPHGMSNESLFTASKAVREAWLAFGSVVERYGVVHAARQSLYHRRQGNDAANLFAEVRNTEVVWPDILGPGSVARLGPPPWASEDRRRRLANLLADGTELWCPTFEQQEERWYEVFGERVKRADLGREQMRGLASVFG